MDHPAIQGYSNKKSNLIFSVLTLYFWMVVYSAWREVREEVKHLKATEHRRSSLFDNAPPSHVPIERRKIPMF